MTHINIEKMKKPHINGVEELEIECFSNPWSKKSLEEELLQPNSVFFVATDGDTVVGYIGLINIVGEGNVTRVAVTEKYRKMGIGSRLIENLISYGNKNLSFITLEVRENNQKAINLYNKYGFVQVGKRKNFYQNPKENALLMTRYFNKEEEK